MELQNREGQYVPEVTLKQRKGGELVDVQTKDIFANRTVAVFSLPGAYTPTCSSTHLPRYNELAEQLFANGVDEILCLSVNDAFVMEAWGEHQEAEHLTLLADGNGEFTEGMGMLVDKTDLGFGKRSWRYSMVVRNGVIDKMFIEPQKPGDPFEVSDADTMLDYLNPQADRPSFATIISKPGCPHCARAKQALADNRIAYEDISIGNRDITSRSLRAMTGYATVPQVWIDGRHIGGAEDLKAHLEQADAA
ncbi:peroxiredoxin (alkyl hydroperoxide reductase subunit C) [Kushneria avicenniae]|uniref:Peroxiredoxin (Alkyl hydroperoxide reductase subunit C) n=1 Tax=Kushneria avicenniae TaxID=402385 RepID=A0A1I1GE23_9GAMM|nr:glutathione peroxidase [Kushneria avicenniae]SFC09705.1 peroxiredoxin (alkyl hydroperoxide reductase subunit C) [Kushneria avicenniae]